MNIQVHTAQLDYLGLEIFDYLVGYWQFATGYEQTPNITFGPPEPGKYNILFLSWPTDDFIEHTAQLPDNLDQYDLVALDNADEPFGAGSKLLYDILDTVPHSRLFCNSILSCDHPYKNQIINTSINWEWHRRYYVESMFPQSYELTASCHPPMFASTGMIYINGRNRSVREHWTNVLREYAPNVPHHNDLHNGIVAETRQSFHETSEDTKFRQWANQIYVNDKINPAPPEQRWPPLPAGVNGRFGATFFEDRVIDCFRESQVIIYPESTWQNNQITLTEKPLRCFIHRKFTMPVSGAYTHQLYAELGFQTLWHLLPPEHQEFDNILDHQERYIQQAKAIQWLWQHPEIFKFVAAEKILTDNQIRCMLVSSQAGKELYNIINENT